MQVQLIRKSSFQLGLMVALERRSGRQVLSANVRDLGDQPCVDTISAKPPLGTRESCMDYDCADVVLT